MVIVIAKLFAKLPWLENSEGSFRSSSQAAACPPSQGKCNTFATWKYRKKFRIFCALLTVSLHLIFNGLFSLKLQ